MMWTLFWVAFVLAIVWLTWKRVLALLVVAIARREKIQLTIDAFTLTAASGIKLKLTKGPLQEVSINRVQLGWGPGASASNILQFIRSRGPRMRVTITGARLKLAPAPSPVTAGPPPTPAAKSTKLPASKTPGNAAAGLSEGEEPGSLSVYLLNLMILEVKGVAVVDEEDVVVMNLHEAEINGTLQRQYLTLNGLNLLPLAPPGLPGTIPTEDNGNILQHMVYLESFSLQHDGALSALRRSGALQRVSVTLGAAAVHLPEDVIERAEGLVHRFKRPKRGGASILPPSTGAAPIAVPLDSPKPLRRSVDSGSGTFLNAKSALPPKLQALPKDLLLEIAKLEVYGVSAEGAKVAFILEAAAVSSRVSDNLNNKSDNPVLSGSASWQKLICSLAADPGAPPALELQCSSSELALTATAAAAAGTVQMDTRDRQQQHQQQVDNGASVALALDGWVKINAMHTRIKHWDLQDLADKISSLKKKPRKDAASASSGTLPASSTSARGAAPAPLPAGAQVEKASAVLASWRLSLSLGEGSSLQFLDEESECMWLSSLQSADLTFDKKGEAPTANSSGDGSGSGGVGLSFQATEIAMTAAQVGPHVRTSQINAYKFNLEKVLSAKLVRLGWQPGAGLSGAGLADLTTDGVHALLHPASVGALADVSESIVAVIRNRKNASKSAAAKKKVPLKPIGLARGASHRRPPPQFSFSFSDTLFVAPATVTVPAEHSSINRMHLVNSTLGAMLAACQGTFHLGAQSGDVALEEFSIVYSESLSAQRFPEDSEVFKTYVKSTVISLSSGALSAYDAATAMGDLGGTLPTEDFLPEDGFEVRRRVRLDRLAAVADADAIGCAIQAADDILAMYQLLKGSTRHVSSASRHSSPEADAYEEITSEIDFIDPLVGLGTSGSELDAVDVVTMNEARAAAARGDGGGGPSGGSGGGGEDASLTAESLLTRPRPPLYIDIATVRVSLPLSADLEVSVEVDALHAELAASRGVTLLQTQATVLSMKGKPVIRWTEFAASLHTPSSASPSSAIAPLPLQPLHPMARSKPGERPSMTTRNSLAASLSRSASFLAADWSMHTSPPSSPPSRAASQRRGGADWDTASQASQRTRPDSAPHHPSMEDSLPSGLLPYHRARLTPWVKATGIGHQSNASSSSMSRSSSAAGTGSLGGGGGDEGTTRDPDGHLGTGPRSIADVHVSGFELNVPYDRDPGPTQRYAEMYFKALSNAFTQSVKVLRKKSQGVVKVIEKRKASGAGMKNKGVGSLFPMQFNLRADGFVFKFEHHPMEKWLAAHGPLLRQAGLQAHLWGEAVATVQQADTQISPLHAGIVESVMAPSDTGLSVAGSVGVGGAAASDDGKTIASSGAASSAAPATGAPTSVGSGAAAGTRRTSEGMAKEQAWEGLMRDLAAQYRTEVAKIAAAAAKAREAKATGTSSHYRVHRVPCEDLLIVSLDAIQVIAVICDGKGAGHDAALDFISEVDPSTNGIDLAVARKLHVDIVGHSLAVSIASTTHPLFNTDRIVISGPIAIAKQRTAPAATTTRTLAVGAHRAVAIQVNVRGCKAPFKLYTDCAIDSKRMSVVFGPGYEPALGLMGLAGKKLAPSDPDRSAPRPPPIPWWDDLRYMWRGKATIRATPLRVVLAAHQMPVVDETSKRMVIRAALAEGTITDGEHTLNFKGFTCSLYQDAGVESSGGALMALPFVHAPVASLRMQLGWKLPNGRDPLDHHIFPDIPPENGLQGPVFAGEVFKAEGMDVGLEVKFGEGAVGADGGPLIITAIPGDGGPAPLGTALAFLGGRQVAFLREFTRNIRSTPPYIKACVKKGTFFAKKPRGGPPKKGLPKLLQLFRLSISASPLEIAHFVADSSDPSAGVRLGASSASFGAAWLCNQPPLTFLHLPPHVRGGSNHPVSENADTRTITQDFSLNLGNITMHKDDPADDDLVPDSPTTKVTALAPGGGSTTGPSPFETVEMVPGSKAGLSPFGGELGVESQMESGTAGYSGVLDLQGDEADSEEGARHAAALLKSLVERRETKVKDSSVLFATSVTVTRRPKGGDGGGGGGDDDDDDDDRHGGPGSPLATALGQRQSRPLRVIVSNCRFLMDLSTRNAVWGAISHLVAAFASSPKATAAGALLTRNGSTVPEGPTPGSNRALSPLGTLLSPGSTVLRRDVTAELQRRLSSHESLRSPSSNSELAGPESNELLSLLLQQREAAGGDGGSMRTTPQASTGEELPPPGDYYNEEGGDGEADAVMTTPLDDVNSLIKYEVEVSDLQVMMLTTTDTGPGPGRLLLAAKSGKLRGLTLHNGPAPLQITTLGLEAVQAYVSITDVDPHVSLSWLQVGRDGFSAPEDGGPAALRRVFNPICIDLRHSKAPNSALATRRGLTGRGLSLRSPTPGGGLGTMMKSEELVLKIPEIAAVMDGREFEVLAEVVSLLLTPGPSIETVTTEEKLLVEGGSEEVEDARQLFTLVRQQLMGLRHEALEVQRCMGLTLQRSGRAGGAEEHAFVAAPSALRGAGLGRDSYNQMGGVEGEGGGPSNLLQRGAGAAMGVGIGMAERAKIEGATTTTLSVSGSADLLPVMTAMREHIAGEALAAAAAAAAAAVPAVASAPGSQPGSPGPMSSRSHLNTTSQRRQSVDSRRDQLHLLLRWVQEQETAAEATYAKTKSALMEAKAEFGKHQVARAASRVLLHLDRIVWQLCTPEKTPFVQAALRGLTFDRHRNRDHSGSAKFIIHRIDIIDATGNLPEGPATPAGVILTCWNPDGSYEREPVLRVVTTMGVPTRAYTVFEHIDATLHPLSLHLTESIAVACWEYFFPKEDSKARQEAFSQTVGSGAGGSRRRGSVTAAAAADSRSAHSAPGDSPMASAVASPIGSRGVSFTSGGEYPGTPSRPGPGAGASAVGGGGSGAGLFRTSGNSSKGGDGHSSLGEASDFMGLDPGILLAPSPSGASTPSAATGSMRGSFRGGAGTAAGGSSTAAGQASSTSSSAIVAVGGGAGAADKGRPVHTSGRGRKRFVYVKLNRAHMRITYQGYPIGIKDRILVINSYTCENLDGRWRDLLANVKQKAILSAVWSGLGLQGRKIRELMDGAAPAVPTIPPPGDEPRGAKGLLAKMGLASKKGKEAVPGPEVSEEELRSFHKKRALFGNQMMRNMATRVGTTHPSGVPIPVPHTNPLPASVAGGGSGSNITGAAAAGGGDPGHIHGTSSASGSVAHSPRTSASVTPRDGPTPEGSPTKYPSPRKPTHPPMPVPPLDLHRPLPPENPGEASGSGSGYMVPIGGEYDRTVSMSPLGAGMMAARSGGGTPVGGGSSPSKGGSGSPIRSPSKIHSGRSSARSADDPVAALLGQGFQQQAQQAPHSKGEAEIAAAAAAAALLGRPSPRGKSAGWMQQLKSLGNKSPRP